MNTKFYTYILFSNSLKKFYTGHTDNIDKRLMEHNRGKGKFTRNGIPWNLIKTFECVSKSEATTLELKIKKRGCKRFLEDLNSSLKTQGQANSQGVSSSPSGT